jgi:hypothetical protein
MVFLLVAATIAAAPSALPAIGVVSMGADHACALIEGPALPAGSEVTIVLPDVPQEVVAATIAGPVASCAPAAGRPMPSSDSTPLVPYGLRLKAGADTAGLGILFVGRIPAKRLSGVYELRASRIYQRVRVRSCASLEGIHLSIWSGTPRASRRLWHLYWYLGFDVEPTCESDEGGDEGN